MMVSKSPIKRKKKKKDYSDVAERYRKGERIVDLAKEYGISRVGMYYRLQEEGIKEFRDDRRKITDPTEAVDRYKQGLTMTDIAKECGCTVGRISQTLKERHVITRNRTILPDLENIEIDMPDIRSSQKEAFKEFQKDFGVQFKEDQFSLEPQITDNNEDNLDELAALLNGFTTDESSWN